MEYKKGAVASPSPVQTPRPSDRTKGGDSRSGDSTASRHDKEKGVNVQVLLRCRPFNDDEVRANAPQQRNLYDHAVTPIINEVLDIFNYTIFAYGQTGTGKTYTMEGGGKKAKNGEFPADAGVIPRAVRQIFDTLEAQNAEYSMKVTFLELYNEEITDLLAPDDYSRSLDDKSKKPIALMEDGKGGVFVRGLEEEIVCSANEESKMASYAQQLREGILRTIESTRVISKINTDFFETLERHASKLSQFVEETQIIHDRKLDELEKSYEECAANEEKQLLEKLAEMLASSTARKTELVQSAVRNLRESAINKAHELQQGMLNMRHVTSDIQTQWNLYMKQAENHYVEDTTSVATGHCCMEEILRECMMKATAAGVQWRNTQDSLQQLEKDNVEAVGCIIESGKEANQLLLANFTKAASSADEEVNIGNDNLLSSIDNSLKLDHEVCINLQSTIAPRANEFMELQRNHYGKVVEITKQADKYLQEDYMEDQASCTTPRRRPITLPSMASIEELRTPCFDELLQAFWDKKRLKQGNGELKQLINSDLSSMRDARIPLIARN